MKAIFQASAMNFYPSSNLETDYSEVLVDLSNGEEFVLTNNGKPSALIVSIPDGLFDEFIQAFRQAKAMVALNSMWRKAAISGFMTDEEIEAAIAEAKKQDWPNRRFGRRLPNRNHSTATPHANDSDVSDPPQRRFNCV